MTDLSFNVIALDRASATFVRMAEQVDRLALRLDKLDGKDVSVDVNVKTNDSMKFLDSFDNRFKLMATGIIAASPAIGAAIIGGVGAGFIGIAALAQKSNEEVQDTYSTLWHNVVGETKSATDQLVPQIVGAGKAINAEMARLGPSISHAFSFAGPDIVALTRGVTDFAQNAMPGAQAAMENSLPIAESASAVMGRLGTTFSNTVTSVSQHSQEFGTDLQSFGNIANSAVGTATDLVDDLGVAWAQNASKIDSAVAGAGASISGLAQGALPVLSAGLNVAFTAIDDVVTVVKPLAPLLGAVGTTAAVTWAGFKLAGLAKSGVKALADGVVSLGANMEAGAAKAGLQIAAMKGVEVEASAAARTVIAAGVASATAATSFGIAAETIAGPLGFALVGGTALLGLFTSSSSDSGRAQQQLAADVDSVTSALEASHGAITQAVEDSVRNSEAFKNLTKFAGDLHMSQQDILQDILQGAPKLKEFQQQLRDAIKAADPSTASGAQYAEKVKPIMDALGALISQWDLETNKANESNTAIEATARATALLPGYQTRAAEAAKVLGLSLGDVTTGFIGILSQSGHAADSADAVAAAFTRSAIQVAAAEQAARDHFEQVDKAAAQAARGVADANHSYQQSLRSVSDAEHSRANAARAVVDAQKNVENAEKAVTRAQQQEKDALIALNAAREKAVQDLKDLHLQLEDQVVSEESAQVRLFDAVQAAAGHGVTEQNAREIASQKVTAANEDQIKAAIDLLSAENSLNDTMNDGAKLRQNVAAADKAGVEGAPGVVSAQQAVASAHDQVTSALDALGRAHQQVTDAAYAEQQAQRQVADAEYQSKRASEQLTVAKQNLTEAQAAASRSLDINTEAGRQNLSLLGNIWDAIEKTGIPKQDAYNAMLEATSQMFGISKQAAADYVAQVANIPPDVRYNVTAVAGVDYSGLINVLSNGDLQLVGGKIFKGMAFGGPVIGVGGPTEDANLIWASHGEYMQPADAVDHYGVTFMDAVRSKKLRVIGTDGAAIAGFASGGPIGGTLGLIKANTDLTRIGTQYQSIVTALGVMGFSHPDGLPKYVPPIVPAINFTAGAGVAQWAPQILQALAQLGQGADWLATVERRMNQESGGNPTVVNKWDSNWLRGTPSVGLMQVIGPTFRAYAGPYLGTGPFEYGVSVNPLANIYAGLNYAIHRYGSLAALNRPGGYDNGGQINPGWTAVYNGTGRPENVRSSAAEDHLLKAIQDRPGVVNKNMTVNLQVANAPTDVMMQLKRAEMMQNF